VKMIEDWRAGIEMKPLPPGAGNWTLCKRLPILKDTCRRVAQRVDQLFALASHAGEVRLVEYYVTIGESEPLSRPSEIDVHIFDHEHKIKGQKRVTYARRSNPWWQMIRMSLDTFPGLSVHPPPVLELDVNYLTQQGAPLMRILGQKDEPAAL